MNAVDPRLHKLLGGDGLAALRRRLRRHFERAAPGAPSGTLRLGSLSGCEREALALLTGRSPRDAKSMQIDIDLLDAKLRDAEIAGSLREALEQIDGPIHHLASVRAAAQASWSAVVAACPHPALAGYLETPAALGLLKRLARQDHAAAGRLLESANAVLRRLPASGLARAQLAAETLGNAHALDNGQAAATLVLATWRHIENQIETSQAGAGEFDEFSADPDAEPGPNPPVDLSADLLESATERAPESASETAPETAPDERNRDVWARAGVLVNELARPVLLLNLPVQPDGVPVCTPGEPAYLSLRRLLRMPPRWAVADRTVFVCENPNVVAIAADRLGAHCASLVCTDGMPAAAQRTLLTQLAQAGARLRYHGDFDWPGLQIANHVMRTWGAHPWRFAAVDYEAATASAPHARGDLAGAPVTASWDAELAPAMQRHDRAIAEEALAASLMGDLREDRLRD